jgi:histone-lysine N-methyltransferase SETD1
MISFSEPDTHGNLQGCEQLLRFGKSSVHGWGVYTDSFIKAGDFVVEYRGILIGNAVADKREKLYEQARIGSDYMFRVDATTVIDATKKGNLARFINASCNPNCFTKVVTTNGIKKIGIFAKRDIHPGEELNYDYKFAPEWDQSKRIPCYCMSFNCRGFMNWDTRLDRIRFPTPGF